MSSIDHPSNTINSIMMTEQASAPATPPSGKQQLYVSASGLSLVNSGGSNVVVGQNKSVRVYNNADITGLAPTGYRLISFNSESYDTDGCHSVSVNTSRLTCNTAGMYFIMANIDIDQVGTYNIVRIYLNNNTEIAQINSADLRFQISGVYPLNVGDYIELYLYPVGGTNRTLWTPTTWFSMTRFN